MLTSYIIRRADNGLGSIVRLNLGSVLTRPFGSILRHPRSLWEDPVHEVGVSQHDLTQGDL
jgi:hypothetical protein